MKYCVDCRHFMPAESREIKIQVRLGECAKGLKSSTDQLLSPIFQPEYFFASTMRSDCGECGKDAALFEARFEFDDASKAVA